MSGNAFPTDASAGAPSYAALAHRLSRSTEYMSDGTAFGSASGLRPGVQPVGAIVTLQVTIPPFAIFVDAGSSQGAYECSFASNEVVNLNARPGSNSRIDRIEVQVPTDPPTGGVRVANVIYTAGTASASPSPPAPSARSATVGFVTVPSGAGAITWASPNVFAVSAGGVMPVASSAVYPSGAAMWEGQVLYDMALNILVASTGATFDQYHPTHCRVVTATSSTTTSPGSTTWIGAASYNNTGSSGSGALNVGGITYSAGVFTVPVPGAYRATFCADWAADGIASSHRRDMGFITNGTLSTASDNSGHTNVETTETSIQLASHSYTVSGLLVLGGGDTVQAALLHSGTGTCVVNQRSFGLVLEARF